MKNSDKKVKVKLIGTDGNIFCLVGKCTLALKKAGKNDASTEMKNRVFKASSYEEALNILAEYVDIQ